MEVKMNKEIRNYQESMFMGLNLRQCIFSLFAILVAVGIYFGLGDYVGQEMTGWQTNIKNGRSTISMCSTQVSVTPVPVIRTDAGKKTSAC